MGYFEHLTKTDDATRRYLPEPGIVARLVSSAELVRSPLPSLARPASLAIAIALAYLAGDSLAGTHWTRETVDLASVAALAAAVLGLVAVLRVPGTIPLVSFALVVGLAIGHFGSADLVSRPGDPASLPLAATWARRLGADAAFGLGGLNTAFFSLLAAATGAVTAWESVRRRRPLLALAPVAIVYSLGVLNSTGDHFQSTVGFLALVLLLWLVTAFSRARYAADLEGLRITGAARRRFLSIGGALTVAVVAVAAIAPPLSNSDASGILDSSLTRLRTALGDTSPGAGVGFSFEVPLSGSLATNSQVVLTYSYDGVAPAVAPLYMRGVNLTQTRSGQWRQEPGQNSRTVVAGQPVGFVETYREQATMTVHVRVVSPPVASPGLLFYPGQLVRADAGLVVTAQASFRGGRFGFFTADEVELLVSPATSYTVETAVSTATEAQLIASGTGYPGWVIPYAILSNSFTGVYRPPATIGRIRTLAQKITVAAKTPYEKARAIETYLRTNYSYTLTPPPTPGSSDPIDYFLFTSHRGYCQFYATAMGDMLRTLGIPTRLVNGFGPGSSSGPGGDYTVTSGDAHTWVEVYFPTYGWIPFEPTPQVGFTPITRGPAIAATAPDAPAPDPTPSSAPVTTPSTTTGAPTLTSGKTPAHPGGLLWALLVAALALAAAALAAATAWRPRNIAGAWGRIRFLGGLAGIERRSSDTPREFGRRLAATYPELGSVMAPVVNAYSEAIYSSRDRPEAFSIVLQGWRRIGPELLRRSLRRAARLA